MPYQIRDLRNLDVNVNYFVATGLVNYGYTIHRTFNDTRVVSGVYLIDGFPTEPVDIKAPAVSIEHLYTNEEPFQLGSGKAIRSIFRIDVFARSDTERDDLGDLVRSFFNSHMAIYDYNVIWTGGTYQSLGSANFENITMRAVRLDTQTEWAQHIMSISTDVIFYINSGESLIII